MKFNHAKLINWIVIALIAMSSCDVQNTDDDNNGNNGVIDNPDGAIVLTCEDFESDITLENDPDKEVDYIIDCLVEITSNIEVEVDEEVVVEFTKGSGIILNSGANLSLVSIPAYVDPIVFRGNKSEKGYWKGICIKANGGCTMNGFEIHDAGSTTDPDFKGALTVLEDGRLSLIHVVVNNSANYGVYFDDDPGISERVSTAEITNCASYPIRIGANDVGKLFGYSEYTISNNNPDRILIGTQDVTSQVAVYDRGVPYEIDGIITVSENGIRIEDGVEIAFNEGSRLIINSYFRASSEPENPIKFYGLEGYAGSWQGIFIDSDVSTHYSTFENVHISDGGEETYGSGNISVESGELRVYDCIITNSRTCGIRIDYTNAELKESGNTFTNNQTGHICETN